MGRKQKCLLLSFLVMFVALSGCAQLNSMGTVQTNTVADLTQGNYKIIETNVTGEDTGSYLFGYSLSAPRYANAMQDLHLKVDMKDKPRAFINVGHDLTYEGLGMLFGKSKVTITADVIEFQD